MDLLDKKILSFLDMDSRAPCSWIAKRLKVSRQVIDYRIGSLIDKRIILNFAALIDPTKFLDNIWHVYLKLQNMSNDIEDELYNYLNEKKEIWWVTKCQGEWDLIFSVAGNDIVEFDRLLMDFRSQFHNIVNEQQITSMIRAIRFPRGHFLGNRTMPQVYISERKRAKLDASDSQILKILATDARMPSARIATLTGLSARQVIYRINELEKKEVIRGFRLHLNFEELGYDYYKVCFYAQDFRDITEKSLITWCEENPYVLYFVKKIAPWTFEIEFEANDYQHLNGILREMRDKFGSMMRRTEITLITKEYKGELNIF